jgi:GxxExxY protein
MVYEEEVPPLAEPDKLTDHLAHQVIGAAIEVHRTLGAGLDEALYQAAMCIELRRRDIPFAREVTVNVTYRGEPIGHKRLDFVIAGRMVLELKAIEQLLPVHLAQVRTYLKLTGLQLGLLINFNSAILKNGIRRIIDACILVFLGVLASWRSSCSGSL